MKNIWHSVYPSFVSISSTQKYSTHSEMKLFSGYVCYLLVVSFVMELCLATPTNSATCACRKRVSLGSSLCAQPQGDPAWCSFHVCAQGYECVSATLATHSCVTFSTKGHYHCLRDATGSVIHPSLHDLKRCKCVFQQDRDVKHILPRKKLSWMQKCSHYRGYFAAVPRFCRMCMRTIYSFN